MKAIDKNKPLPVDVAEDIYNLLVKYCRATETMREMFLNGQTRQFNPAARFISFGGAKFKRNRQRWFVEYAADEIAKDLEKQRRAELVNPMIEAIRIQCVKDHPEMFHVFGS